MGKITGRKRKLNYKPIFYVAAFAIPAIIIVTIFIRPAQEVPLKFIDGPHCNASLRPSGTVRIWFGVNQKGRSMVFYRYNPGHRYQAMSTTFGTKFAVAVPAKVGQVIEYYVEVTAGRQEIKSQKYKVTVIPATTTGPDAER